MHRTRAEWEEFFVVLYQLAGDLTLSDDDRTQAEKDRMRELLLDALHSPENFTAEGIRAKHELAVSR